MNYILNIHTSDDKAIVNLCSDTKVLATLTNDEQKRHAAFLHPAIRQVLADNEAKLNNLQAIGVTAGPGSYTGIRVGLAAAKGLCYAQHIPLLLFNTLEVMAFSAIEHISDTNALYCPMIDARRQEVFTGVYDCWLNKMISPSSVILNENSFGDLLREHSIYFFGSGALKFEHVVKNGSAMFCEERLNITSQSLCNFSRTKFKSGEFENPAQARPFYLKDFQLDKN